MSQTRIIPTFGKPKNLKKDIKKPVVKAKKFVPPVKNTLNNEQNSNKSSNSQKQQSLDQRFQPTPNTNLTNQAKPNQSKNFESVNFNSQFTQNVDVMNMGFDHNMSQITQNIDSIETYPNLLTNNSIIMDRIDLFDTQQGIENVNNIIEDISNTEILPHSQGSNLNEKNNIKNRVSLPPRMKTNILGSIISSSLNILDNEHIIPTENLSLEAHSDPESLQTLSQNQNQSFCSVTSLSKTYKNLDSNSFKNGAHRILEGDEFCDLFKNNFCEKVKPVAMSTEFGDIGFNTKYSDFMKDFGLIDEQTEEEKETCLRIVNMYPKENSILKKKLYK